MPSVTLDHFKRAAQDVAAHGDNDMLPFDVDNRFIAENQDPLSQLAYAYFEALKDESPHVVKRMLDSALVFSERLLAPTGPAGFRITTKIHPFWNLYFNGLGVAIAEAHEPTRSNRAHSYRFVLQHEELFDRAASWRAFREATILDCDSEDKNAVVVQTDITSFYEHVYHHRIENFIDDILPKESTVSTQVDRLLVRFASGRSFGLPVGGQCSRILAELLLGAVDRVLTDAKVVWRRYVDDFVLITKSQADAYRALSVLSHALADYGLSLNRTKTTFLTSKHYVDYVRTQLGDDSDAGNKLREIDLHFDPYSDTAESDYEELKETVEAMDVRLLLDMELRKAQPDTFLVTQIGRTLKLHDPEIALQLCRTLLAPMNLHAFRASWSTIMRGVASVQAEPSFVDIHAGLDALLDAIPGHSAHLLRAEASCLHFLRTIRFRRTQRRAEYVMALYDSSRSESVKRACIECWRLWKDRTNFIRLRNMWNAMGAEEQRMLWLAADEFGDDGENFRRQVKHSLAHVWRLGVERGSAPSFASIYEGWATNAP